MWRNGRHPPMPPRERAKQFLPFAAVTGLEEALREKERLFDERAELSTDMEEEVDRLLHALQPNDVIRVVYFLDGRYRTVQGEFLCIREDTAALVLQSGESVPLSDVYSIERETEI